MQYDAQKYTKVFFEVPNTKRDSKIIGEQACDLLLSWKLPRGIEKPYENIKLMIVSMSFEGRVGLIKLYDSKNH